MWPTHRKAVKRASKFSINHLLTHQFTAVLTEMLTTDFLIPFCCRESKAHDTELWLSQPCSRILWKTSCPIYGHEYVFHDMKNTARRVTPDLKQKNIQHVRPLILQVYGPPSMSPPLPSIWLPNAGWAVSICILQTATGKKKKEKKDD